MGWIATLSAMAISLVVMVFAGFMHARRSLRAVGLIPWDYMMMLSAIFLVAALAHGAILWREGWPLPF